MLEVRRVRLEDAPAQLALEKRNRAFFQKFTGIRNENFYTLEEQHLRIQRQLEAMKQDQGYYFVLLNQGDLIGEIALTGVARGHLQSAWIGYFLDEEENGKGYMTEAVKIVTELAFQELDFHRLEAGVMPHNTGSLRVLEKSGYHREGLARQNVKINGSWQDHVSLAIINPADLV
ncbi:GNAT family N-acetyltransferase [Listeria costaricensis]|uniref:GNAT family N-acetyltransferase n=1 Tax=Listeria costaricensis TaxID=2026604 RepID=UPI000C077213|nr:GNAT family protein [Listeria costaricensis]